MTETDRLVDELRRAFDGDAWHGDPLLRILDGLDAAQAAAHPIPGAHSIWELVLHVASWMRKGAERVRTRAAVPMADADDWPAVPPRADAGSWANTIELLRAAQRGLLEAVAALDDADLHTPLGTRDRAQGTGGSVAFLLHGLAQHAAYHAGQIALLKRALGLRP